MPPDLSPDAWAQIRYDHEHTDRPIPDICAEHGISSGTLRDRMRRWGWTRRRQPIPTEGLPPAPAPCPAPSLDPFPSRAAAKPERLCSGETASADEARAAANGEDTAGAARGDAAAGWNDDASAPDADDPAAIVPRLQAAVFRLLPAIEATVATLGAQPVHPREMERTARVLAALTRTLRELNTLLRQCPAPAPGRGDDVPEDIEEFRERLARKIERLAAEDAAAEAAAAAARET